MNVIGIIPARYESSRFPGKPLAKICGKPMIWWVYQQCKKVKSFDEVYVATDDKRIGSVCENYGILYLMTSSTCSTGSDRVAEASRMIDADVFINVQGDEPLIKPEMIEELITVFRDFDNVYYATLKSRIEDEMEIQSENTVKVVTDLNGVGLYFSRSVIPSGLKGYKGEVYRHVGIYGYRKDFLLEFAKLPKSELELAEGIEPLRALESGYRIHVSETNYKSVGVDVPEHISVVENIIMQGRNL